jgi:hypothetical protein
MDMDIMKIGELYTKILLLKFKELTSSVLKPACGVKLLILIISKQKCGSEQVF